MSMMTSRSKRTISDLTPNDVDPVVHALLPLVASLDRDDERTAGVVEAIESLFFKLKQGSVSQPRAAFPAGAPRPTRPAHPLACFC